MATLREFLLEQMKIRDMSARQLAEYVGVPNTVISRAISERKPTTPNLPTLNKIAQGLGVDVFTLVALVVPGAGDIDPEARLAAQEIVRLPPDERKMLMRYLRGTALEEIKEGK